MFSKEELFLIKEFLEELDDIIAGEGSNEVSLPNTPENRELLREVAEWNWKNVRDSGDLSNELIRIEGYEDNGKKEITGINTELLYYLVSKIEERKSL